MKVRGSFANGAATAAMAYAFNQLQSFLDSAESLRAERRLIGAVRGLNEEDFRTLFPSYESALNLVDLDFAKDMLFEDWRLEVASGRLLEAAREGSSAVQEEALHRTLRASGLTGQSIRVVGRALGLSDRQIRIMSDVNSIRVRLGSDVATTRRISDLAAEVREQRRTVGD